MRARLHLAAWIAAIALGAGAVAGATTVVRLDEPALRAGADAIVLGTVVAIRTVAVDLGPGVFTDVDVAVDEDLRDPNASPRIVTLRIPGGELDGRRVIVEGMPTFEMAERIVLFAEAVSAWNDAYYLPVGLNQGVWRADAAGLFAPTAQDGLIGDPAAVAPRDLAALRRLAREVAP
jgi:hypothetical protein